MSRFRLNLARVSVTDTIESWDRHRRKHLPYYTGFGERWALAGEGLRRVLVPYHRLIDRPVDIFAEIARLFDGKVDMDRVSRAVRESDVREMRQWTDFPYSTESKSWVNGRGCVSIALGVYVLNRSKFSMAGEIR